MSEFIILDETKNAGIITINRPKALNSVTDPMMKIVLDTIRRWQHKTVIIFQGNKLLSAGGDVKSLWEKGFMGPIHVYNAAYAAHVSRTPVVAFMEGYTMGAVFATSVLSKFHVATDDTVAAMPEVKIGMMPDVGASYFLPRLKRNVGFYMGLTASSLKGKDVLRAGLATHFVPKNKLQQLKQDLLTVKTSDDIQRMLDKYSESDNLPPLAENIKDIEYCFGANSLEDIMRRLERLNTSWARESLQAMQAASPGCLRITWRSLNLGRDMDVWSCLCMDYTFVYHALRNHDFKEGIRAVLVEKDYKPKWNPATLADATDEYVDSFFRPSPEAYRLKLVTTPSKL